MNELTTPSLPARLAIGLIRSYRRFLSPILGRRCRFYPTCSAYAIEVIEKKGLVRGLAKAGWRILRCNPFGQGGYDPVDPKREDAGRNRLGETGKAARADDSGRDLGSS